MGKTPEKLRMTILVDETWINHPKMDELREKGHRVELILSTPSAGPPHLILSRSAHMWSDEMWPLLDVTLKAARARKKGQPSAD
jgi:hypothetical protein